MDIPRYLTLLEAAHLMRSSKSKLRDMHDGPPRFHAPKSRVWFYPSDELIAWICLTPHMVGFWIRAVGPGPPVSPLYCRSFPPSTWLH